MASLFHSGSIVQTIVKKFTRNPTWGLVFAIMVTLVTNIVTVVYIQSLQTGLQSMYKEDLIGQNYIQTARISLYTLDKLLNQLFLFTDPAARKTVIGRISSSKRDFESLLNKSKRLYHSKKEASQIVAVHKTFTECRGAIDTLVTLSALDRRDKSPELIIGGIEERFRKVDSLLDKIDNNRMKHDIRLFKDIDYSLTVSILFTLATIVATIGFKSIVYWLKRQRTSGVAARERMNEKL